MGPHLLQCPMEKTLNTTIESWKVTHHKLESIETLFSAKTKLLITNIYLKDYSAMYIFLKFLRKCHMASYNCPSLPFPLLSRSTH